MKNTKLDLIPSTDPRPRKPLKDPWGLVITRSNEHGTQWLSAVRESRHPRACLLHLHDGPEAPPGWYAAMELVARERPGTLAEVRRIVSWAMLESMG